MDLLVLVLLVAGLVVGSGLLVVGVLGLRERLPRNRFAGVRTPAAMTSARAFVVANKVAGLPIAVAGVVGLGSGIAGLAAGPDTTVGLVVAALGLVGTAGIAVAGGVVGHRAAEAVPEEAPEVPAGCRGCACGGCELAGARSVGADVTRMSGE